MLVGIPVLGMPLRIEDYALIGDTRTAALVGRDGSIDWLFVPRFDSAACFAALLGDREHGRWRLAPSAEVTRVERRYRDGTLVLETEFETADGAARVIDCMPQPEGKTEVARVVERLRGRVAMETEHRVPFLLSWYPSAERPPGPLDVERAVAETERWWIDWSERCNAGGEWRDVVTRSLITLKALTYGPTGGIVAAPTTSLPEQAGRRAQLGLPLLLAARRDAHVARAD